MLSNPQSALDTNVLLRFLLKDHPTLSPQARNIILTGKHYLDEIILAQVIWVLSSYYKQSRHDIAVSIDKLLSLPHLMNPRKSLILQAVQLYKDTSLEYVDCWLLTVSKAHNLNLTTFDKKLTTHLKI